MFLKSIDLIGFKSFANKTKVNFIDGLTIIVGPNGSGKSNVNDAIRWVLGERSKKSLRASEANDVIFAGTKDQPQANFAEVTLTFDNSTKIINNDDSTVKVTRRIDRDDPESTFLINGEVVRRKDVINLFLDTGLGNVDLAIISQGSISKIAEAQPEELKNLLNETAGVSKYQLQKEESLRKLEKVDQSLQILEVKLEDLDKQLKPIRAHKAKAEKYNKLWNELKEIELPLIKHLLKVSKEKHEFLIDEINKNEIIKSNLTYEIDNYSSKIDSLTNQFNELENTLAKYQIKYNELASNSASLFNQTDEKKIEALIKKTSISIKEMHKLIKANTDNNIGYSNKILDLKNLDNSLEIEKDRIKYKLTAIQYELTKHSNTSNLDRGTKEVIENKKSFNTIYGLVQDLIDYESKYQSAIATALGNKLKNIVVENENTIKDVLYFLKSNKLGKATMIPRDKVVTKNISSDYLEIIERQEGFLGTVASNISTKADFRNVVNHLGGNILMFDNIDNALACAKLINYRFLIVTLDGDVIYTGFVVRGGYEEHHSQHDIKKRLQEQEKQFKKELDQITKKSIEVKEEFERVRTEHSIQQNESIRLAEKLVQSETLFSDYLSQYKKITGKEFEIGSLSIQNKDLSFETMETLNTKIKELIFTKTKVNAELFNLRKEYDVSNKQWKTSTEIISKGQIELEKLVRVIDSETSLLVKEYKLTVESLIESEDIVEKTSHIDSANKKRQELRKEIQDLGFIDHESIINFETLDQEYQTLKVNVEDLRQTKDKLISTINTMNDEMKHKIAETFKLINEKLDKVFIKLFGGGHAKIEFENPDNILESDIIFEGQTPGKLVKSISLYSGGEKSLMALSLLFAVNEVKRLPLLILDEVEAALDEMNVEKFAKFCKKINDDKTQVIVVTHRPGTMAAADILYGVTMEKKGISKIVSVKLDTAVRMVE